MYFSPLHGFVFVWGGGPLAARQFAVAQWLLVLSVNTGSSYKKEVPPSIVVCYCANLCRSLTSSVKKKDHQHRAPGWCVSIVKVAKEYSQLRSILTEALVVKKKKGADYFHGLKWGSSKCDT